MEKEVAVRLADTDMDYVARKMHGQWVVWCEASDHAVEFNLSDIKRIEREIEEEEAAYVRERR